MFTITQDYINQFGINIKNHLLTIKHINYTVNSVTQVHSEKDEPVTSNSSYLSYAVESFISQEAYDSGAQGMPVTPLNIVNPSGTFYVSSPEIPENTTLLEFCQNHFVASITNGALLRY